MAFTFFTLKMYHFQSSVTNASLSGSEGGSGDGTVGSLPLSPRPGTEGENVQCYDLVKYTLKFSLIFFFLYFF